ncbi:Sensor histidine kinase, PAS domain-containing [Desulfonema limicola]|uniref:Oxygen sensor histidine kinase NreB n=1 Tax=Desulfonema limicola TaxID=45656 RepID=A0A975B7V0_9BACT|nr:PAS domain S-box protein [Desulfonema limicola]QTA80195.1 Sensor histidine kinase, PAS domain-containing [Desulfonema limicola]
MKKNFLEISNQSISETEKLEKELALKNKELKKTRIELERFKNFFIRVNIGMVMGNLDGYFFMANLAFCKMLGYTEEELLKKNIKEITHPDDFKKSQKYINDILEGKINDIQLTKRYIHKNGCFVWGLLNLSLVRDEKQHPSYFIAQIQDISEKKQAEIESQKQDIIESAIDIISFVDRDVIHYIDHNMNIIWASEAAVRVHGIIMEKLLAQKCYNIFWKNEQECQDCPVLKSKETGQIERSVINRTGLNDANDEAYWEEYSIPLKNGNDSNIKFVVVSRNITEKVKSEKALQESAKKLRFLADRLLTAQEQERKRLALGLHDELGQSLAVLKLNLNAVKRELKDNQEPIKNEIQTIIEYTDNIIENVRRLSRDLTPSVIEDLGLTGAIRWLIEGYSERFKIHILYNFPNIDSLFSENNQINIYRIFQEIFNNIRKHAQTDSALVNIAKKGDYVSFEVEDHGQGFDIKSVNKKTLEDKGLGLAAMEERVRILGGYIKISSSRGNGTKIRFVIPTCE